MSNRVQIHEIRPDRDYAVGWYEGDSYCGPGGGYLFWEGVVPNPVPGPLALQNSLPIVGVYFEYAEGHALRWDGNEWLYEAAERETSDYPDDVAEAIVPDSEDDALQSTSGPVAEPPPKPRKPKAKAKRKPAKKKPAQRKPGRPKGSKNKAK